MSDTLADYDYVIAGGGAAGCLIANRLSADENVRVLLVEAGEGGDSIWTRLPIGYFKCLGNPLVDWCEESEPVPGLGGRRISLPRGRGLGGSTSIGGMIHLRGQPEDFNGWAAGGCDGWGWDEVLPYFLKHEDQAALRPAEFAGQHAGGGEWRIEASRVHWPVLDAWLAAAEQAGYPRVANFNLPGAEGVGAFMLSQQAGMRIGAAKAFLGSLVKRKNLSIVTQALVDRIRISDGRATGVLIRRNGFPMSIGARREVILTAGAVGSPMILMRSGIGPYRILQDAGIAVSAAIEGVGRNLQDHFEIPVVYRTDGASSLNPVARDLLAQARMVAKLLLKRSGPVTMAPASVGAMVRSDDRQAAANLLLKGHPFSFDETGRGFADVPAITISATNLRPASRGQVWITSPDVMAQPSIQPDYLSSEADREAAVAALTIMRSIGEQPALRSCGVAEIFPGPAAQSFEELLAAAELRGRSASDAVGTCAMGRGGEAVVDPRLLVNGVEGLRIADASVMPTLVSGSAGAATLMIAEKAAAMIAEDWAG